MTFRFNDSLQQYEERNSSGEIEWSYSHRLAEIYGIKEMERYMFARRLGLKNCPNPREPNVQGEK